MGEKGKKYKKTKHSWEFESKEGKFGAGDTAEAINANIKITSRP
jgi:hypothetical protein